MSILDANGDFHDRSGRYAGHVRAEADPWDLAAPPAPPSPRELYDQLPARTRMQLLFGGVTQAGGLLNQVIRSLRAEGYVVEEPAGDLARAVEYAQFAYDHRDLVGTVPGWGTTEYQEMTRAWREAVGEVHPDDAEGRPWWQDVLEQVPDDSKIDPEQEERVKAAIEAARSDADRALVGFLPEPEPNPPF